MRYGLGIINFGAYAEPALLQEVARTAEGSGWDGLFLWDHVACAWEGSGPPTADAWTLLAAAACVTERMRLGTNVTPLPRHKPHLLATQVATVDRLSRGRVVLGVGLGGVPEEFERFGEDAGASERGEKVDEALAVITGLWSGEAVRHRGRHYMVDGVANPFTPAQRPRPPVWVGGRSGPAYRRAARWDGWTIANYADASGRIGLFPDDLAAGLATIGAHRNLDGAFDVSVEGYSEPSAAGAELVASYEAAGATWWLEGINGLRGSVDEMRSRIAAGPPRR